METLNPVRGLPKLVDYSQEGQALILQQLITPDVPRIVVDIGAHDGLISSNSRGLLLQGWHGLLVEPVPAVFQKLVENCSEFRNVECVSVACSDSDGSAEIFLGRDRADGQLASISREPEVVANLGDRSFQVATQSLPTLLSTHDIPHDFGVLLIDTEGLDLTVLRGLKGARWRPRIIVTEELAATNPEKYALLAMLDYRFAGVWGSDSIWVAKTHPASLTSLRYPSNALQPTWKPSGQHISWEVGVFDGVTRCGTKAFGWAFLEGHVPTETAVILQFDNQDTCERSILQAWRFPRLDVCNSLGRKDVLFSGYRAFHNLRPGSYQLTVIQQTDQQYATSFPTLVTI